MEIKELKAITIDNQEFTVLPASFYAHHIGLKPDSIRRARNMNYGKKHKFIYLKRKNGRKAYFYILNKE